MTWRLLPRWTKRGRAGVTATAAAAVLVLSCAPRGGRHPTDEAPRYTTLAIWVPPVVRWEPGQARELRFAIENASNRSIALAGPDPAWARVDVYAGPENDRVCGTPPIDGRASQATTLVLAPGDLVSVRVGLDGSCSGLPPGEYRFVVSYRSPPARSDAEIWTGRLPAQYGTILVERHLRPGASLPDTAARARRPEGPAGPLRARPEETFP